jgi:hypothetical protein
MHGFCGCFDIANNAVNAIALCMKFIIAQLKTDIQENQKTGCHPDGKSQDIDQGKNPVPPEIPKRDFEIIPEHFFYS